MSNGSGNDGRDDELLEVGEGMDPFTPSEDDFDDLLELEDMGDLGSFDAEDLGLADDEPPATPSGPVPPGSVPQGSVPQGSVPPGSVPQGSVPQGSVPQGSVPQGSVPQGSVPQGSVPPGSVPQGSPPGAGPDGAGADASTNEPDGSSFMSAGRGPRRSGRVSSPELQAVGPASDQSTPASPTGAVDADEHQEWDPDADEADDFDSEGSADFATGMVDELFGEDDLGAALEDDDESMMPDFDGELEDMELEDDLAAASDIEELMSQDVQVLSTGEFEAAGAPPPPPAGGGDLATRDEDAVGDELTAEAYPETGVATPPEPVGALDSSDELEELDSSDDLEAIGSSDDLEALGSSDDLEALDSSDDLEALGSSDDLEALESSDDLEDRDSTGEHDFEDELLAAPDEPPTAAPSTVLDEGPAPEATPEVPRLLGPAVKQEHTPEPAPEELADDPYLTDHSEYRAFSRRLARGRKWSQLAEMTDNALRYADWAALPEVRSSLLLELARLHADRLDDDEKAEESFERLSWEDPTNREALEYLGAKYKERHDYRALHDLHARAVDGTWDPSERLEHTRQAVEIATEQLDLPALAIADWEHLWSLGEANEEVTGALTDAYRQHGRWDKLATFLVEAMTDLEEDQKRPHMREVAEIYLSSQRAPEKASPIIDAIRQVRPTDPVALLAQARIAFQARDFDQLAALSRIEGIEEEVARDIRRVAADALWQAGERQLAVDVYESILDRDPEDRDALRAKERHFTESENWTALCAFLESRAGRAAESEGDEPETSERVELLERAAEIAEEKLGQPEHAISLWQRRIDIGGPTPDAYRNLTRLYETTGNQNGVANALEGLLELTHQPRARVEILARLGEIYARHLDDDLKGEEMWRALLAIDPSDTHAQRELAEIYKGRGDFEALDQTLARQIASAGQDEVLDLVNAAANNIEENIGDPERSASAWEQVLDYAPDDQNALGSLARRMEELEQPRQRIAALELQTRAAEDQAERIDLTLQVAEEWKKAGATLAAVATWERVLRWDPTEQRALDAMERMADDAGDGAVRCALELASNLAEDNDTTIGRLERVLGLIKPANDDGRIALLRRLVSAGDQGALQRLAAAVDKADRHADLASVYLQLAGQAEDDDARRELYEKLAKLNEGSLDAPDNAFLALASMGFDARRHREILPELERLGKVTGRWEDLLVIYDGLAASSFEEEDRRAAMEARYRILSEELEDYGRAFEELRRILAMADMDQQVLERAEKLAEKQDLARPLLALYGQLWDRANTEPDRLDIAAKRHKLVSEVLEDKAAGLEALILRYRVAPSQALEEQLLKAADELKAWAVVVPRLEATALANEPSRKQLVSIAELYEEKLQDKDRAFELYADVLLRSPGARDIADELARLAEATDQRGRLAMALRGAAARAQNTNDALELYRRVAKLYVDHLDAPTRAIDIHRRILRLAPTERSSIDALIKWHREREEWGQLRDRLTQRIQFADEDEDVAPMWMEVATLCREQLDDPEGALDAYSKILADDGEHDGARQGVQELTGDAMSAEVQARRLRLELNLASEEERPDVLLSLADLQLDELNNPGAARETLTTLVDETGAAGPGFKPLAKVLEQLELWRELIELLERHAEESETDAPESLRRALELADAHGAEAEDLERIAQKLRALEPDNQKLYERLARNLRRTGRWEELCNLLEEAIESTSDEEEKLILERELARTRDLAMEDVEGTHSVLDQILERYPEDLEALHHKITLARRKEDLDSYVELREREADRVAPEWGALIHCHLAEVSDEAGEKTKVAAHYRKARKLDADNPVAGDALRALGRRLKTWRDSAALLPDKNEKELSWKERSEKLVARGESAESDTEALDWYRRAVATYPDNPNAWTGIARVQDQFGDDEARLDALLGALGAFERTVQPSAETLNTHAQRLHDAAKAAEEAGDTEVSRRLNSRAHALFPDFAPAALAVADALEDEERYHDALDLYTGVIESDDSDISDEVRGYAVFRRGRLAAKANETAMAIDDLRATVRRNPLHEEALDALGTLHAEQGHVALALANVQQALVVAVEKQRRGELYYRIGQLWDDGLGDGEEAGIYYELALEHGAADPALMRRALDHYKRDERHDEALSMVDELIDNTDGATTLASLWVTRGEILEGIAPEDAIEAFDMALSYEPGAGAALDGLERMLAAGEEWDQLSELIEGRIESAPSPEAKAESLRRLAALSEEHLDDQDRAVDALRRVIELEPDPEALDKLLRLTEDSSAEEREGLLVHAVEYGTRRFDKAIELAQIHLKSGRRLQAWALLAPLRAIIHLDPELKDAVNELRQEFEREDADQLFPFMNQARPEPEPVRAALYEVLERLRQEMGPAGITDLDAVTDGAVQVSESTPNGKLFAQLRDMEGIDKLALYRSVELPENIVVVDSDEAPLVCLKTEIFQKASGGELHYWMAQALELSRPEVRFVNALPLEDRKVFPMAVLAALDLAEEPAGASSLIRKIEGVLNEELKEELLAVLEFAIEEGGTDAAENFWAETVASAQQVAALVVADLRAAWRALSRQYDDIPEQRAVKSLDDLNDMFDNDPRMSRLLSFYASPQFSEFLEQAK